MVCAGLVLLQVLAAITVKGVPAIKLANAALTKVVDLEKCLMTTPEIDNALILC